MNRVLSQFNNFFFVLFPQISVELPFKIESLHPLNEHQYLVSGNILLS